MIITIYHHIHIPAHFIAIIYIQDPTIHHITGEITQLIHIYIIAHIYQDILQLEVGLIMIQSIIDHFHHHIYIIDHTIVIIIQAQFGHHIIHHMLIEVMFSIKNLI